jgi:hypothetical protein
MRTGCLNYEMAEYYICVDPCGYFGNSGSGKTLAATIEVYIFPKTGHCNLVGEWKTRQAMEKHFQTLDFEVLIDAAKVLGKTFTMNIAEVKETGGGEWVSELIMSKKQKSTKKNRA